MSIVLESLTKRYGATTVVADLSLEIAAGEIFVLLGPSGSGKSTLLRMIAGLTELDAGRVHLGGRDITDVPASDRGIGFVFQSYALFRNMTVADNVEFALRVQKVALPERRERREEQLALVGLAGFGGRFPSQLSGGQQQRVALARALASRPPVLLLDEPFGALDAKIRVELRETLRQIQRELGVTVVFVTHDQDEAFALGDRIGVMHLGQLLEVGAPRELYLRPRSAFVATFLGVANFLVGEATATAVKLGPIDLPLGTETPGGPEGQRVQVVLRPEDLELAPTRSALRATPIAPAVVEDRSFAGAFERLRVRLDQLPGVRQVTPAARFGASGHVFEITRPQPEAQTYPIEIGATVWVGARRAHTLAPARLELVVPSGPEWPGADVAAAYARELAASVRAALHSWPDALAPGGNGVRPSAEQALGEGFRMLVLGTDEGGPPPDLAWFADEAFHYLLVPRRTDPPTRLLVCVAAGEPGKLDVRLAERLAWRGGGRATVLTVLPGRAVAEAPGHVREFLHASARVLSARGVPTLTRVRFGDPAREILAERAEGDYDLLVVGAPPGLEREGLERRGVVGRLLHPEPPCPVLIVNGQSGR
jgi:sulfate/thiosulfate transport system ATP-binding protein